MDLGCSGAFHQVLYHKVKDRWGETEEFTNLQRSLMEMEKVPSQSGRLTRASSKFKTCFTFPNEDWTKVSDNVERRRMQNRIAQRKYRKYVSYLLLNYILNDC